jgi:hypothetical protein
MADRDLERANQVINATLQRTDRVITLADARGKNAMRNLARSLRDGQKELERRLRREARRHGGPDARFTGAQLGAYRAQLDLSLRYVQGRIQGLTVAAARAAAVNGWQSTAQTLGALEAAFTGSVAPLRIDTAAMMNRGLRGVRASVLRRTATSVDRYGLRTIGAYERTIGQGLLVGASQSEMIDALVGRGGPTGVVSMAAVEVSPGVVKRVRLEAIPEGLFRRYRYWATRIVRTEVANAQNAAAVAALESAKANDFPDMQKKILAMMDARTAPDSIAVHGQIRETDAMFRDGAGREYLHPPARPNDREAVIPWRPEWTETEASAPRPTIEEAVEQLQERLGTQNPPQADVAAATEAGSTPEAMEADMEAARIARRRAHLGEDLRDRAITEDLREMGEPELTPESLQTIAKDMAPHLERFTGGANRGRMSLRVGRELRMGIRRMIRTVDPNFVSRDVTMSRGARFAVKRRRNARFHAAHYGNGNLAVRNDVLRHASEGVQRIAAGERPSDSQLDAIGTLIHEEHHGSSIQGDFAYEGRGAVYEEATVEHRSRRYTERLSEVLRNGEQPRIDNRPMRVTTLASGRREVDHQQGAYGRHIRRLLTAVSRSTGLSGQELEDHMQARLSSWFSQVRARGSVDRSIQNEPEYLAALAEHLDPENSDELLRFMRE